MPVKLQLISTRQNDGKNERGFAWRAIPCDVGIKKQMRRERGEKKKCCIRKNAIEKKNKIGNKIKN